MIRRFPIPKKEYYEEYLQDFTTEDLNKNPPETREEFDRGMRESLREEYPNREIEGFITIIEQCEERIEDAWFHWQYTDHYCDCPHCNDDTEIY